MNFKYYSYFERLIVECLKAALTSVMASVSVLWCAVQLYAQLMGEEPLPWEGDRLTADVTHKLGVFAESVLALLSRDPDARPSMHEFAQSCEDIFEAPKLPQQRDSYNTTI